MLHFGDNLANFKPIEHLYKTDVIKLARLLKSRDEVTNQSPSAGFWENQEDLEDIAYWIINEGPIIIPKQFSDMEIYQAEKILVRERSCPELQVVQRKFVDAYGTIC